MIPSFRFSDTFWLAIWQISDTFFISKYLKSLKAPYTKLYIQKIDVVREIWSYSRAPYQISGVISILKGIIRYLLILAIYRRYHRWRRYHSRCGGVEMRDPRSEILKLDIIPRTIFTLYMTYYFHKEWLFTQ